MRTKAVIEFTLPDEQAEYDAIMLARARDARSFNALDRIHRIVRAQLNYSEATVESLRKALLVIREISTPDVEDTDE